MVDFLSLDYCITMYNGETQMDNLWQHDIFHPARLAQGTNHLPLPFIAVTRNTPNTS